MSSYMAKKAAQQKASTLLEPLLSMDDDSSDEETADGNGEYEIEKQSPLQKLKTMGVYTVLVAGVGLSAAAMVLSPQTLVFVAGGICCANVPYSAYKENALSKIPTLRNLNNALRQDANRLADEVDTLSDEIDALEPEADRAAAVEEELRDIAERQHYNVDKLVDLVKENGEIIEKMKDNLRRRIAQDVVRIVISSDTDGDGSISRNEAKGLSLKIKLQLETYGVEFDMDKFLKVVGMSPTVAKVIAIAQRLLPSEDDVKNNDEDEGFDSDDMDMFYIVEDDNGSISVTSEDIIGATNAFFGDSSPSVGRTRKSLIANARGGTGRRRSIGRNALSGGSGPGLGPS